MAESGDHQHLVEVESRLAATLAVLVAAVLTALLPDSVAAHPRWLLPALAVLVGVVLLVVTRDTAVDPVTPQTRARLRKTRVLALVMTAILSLANFVTGLRLVADILRGRGIGDAATLVFSGGAVWITNVIVFSLWFWELDRGGRIGRAGGRGGHDFFFPQWGAPPEFGLADWEPEYLDYFYFAFTNAAAFSPTDVMPLSQWAKLTMLLQSALSVGIIIFVVGKAVNML